MLSKVDMAHLSPGLVVYVGLFTEVQNATYLRQQLLDSNTDYEFAFLDAKMLLSTTHVLAAVYRAVQDMSCNRMKSRNIHSETVFAFNASNNITEAYRKFGISDKTTDLLVIKISASDPSAFQKVITENLQGVQQEFNDSNLAAICDEASIRKTYKLQALGKESTSNATETSAALTARRDLETSILGLMALRGAT